LPLKIFFLFLILSLSFTFTFSLDPGRILAFFFLSSAKRISFSVSSQLPQYENNGDDVLQRVGGVRSHARQLVFEIRKIHNAKYQPRIVALLKELGFEFQTYWITNSILVKNVTPGLIKTLRYIPEIIELELNKDIAFIDPVVESVSEVEASKARVSEWNVEIIGAHNVWNVTTGEGITSANIDTGVLYTHVALIDNYRGNNGGGSFSHDYNWFDPRGIYQYPYDNNGHGTHTMGTIAGSEASGVGVAPGTKWIAAKGCASSSCATADLIASAQWVICPTTQAGTSPDCARGADLINNSWGGGRGSSTYKTYIQAWIDAGSVPLFSQGNAGPSCSTANSPGDLAIVIGVGSTNRNDALSSFSSRGPGVGTVDFPLQKPDISAPGESVRSSYYTSNTAYATLSGTSMACPAVAGLTALLMSANPSLSVANIREILVSTAKQGLAVPNGGLATCNGISYVTYPNYHYGWGRIDAVKALQAALKF